MTSTEHMETSQPTEDVAGKVLRRAQVSKMARALQNRLALAHVKVSRGWQDLTLDTIEPKIELELKRKRPGSSTGAQSDTSSSVSDRFFPIGGVDSSPLTAPMFLDDLPHSGSSHGHRKRTRNHNGQAQQYSVSSSHARTKVRTSQVKATSWKSNYQLPESSPVYHTRHAHFASSHTPRLSFVSQTSTVRGGTPDPLDQPSEEDDEDLPTLSFHNQSHLHSSPPRIPRTPSPDIARSARLRSKPFTNANGTRTGEDSGADLLMFLAASPSPAVPNPSKSRPANPPSTPPPKSTPLPSSMMSTPGGGSFMGFNPHTPGMPFNFADYLNVTPSPAQAAWARTPAAAKTPLAAREARRRLNFDSLHPPTGDSPRIGDTDAKVNGLGMELGGELVSSQ